MADNTVPFLAPWGAPTASAVANTEPVFLAPAVIGGLPFLAPQFVPELVRAPVLSHGATAYFAPPLANGLPFLAPQFVPVTLTIQGSFTGGGRRATASRTSRAKSSPAQAPTHYHSRSDEQEIERLAAQLDDEEIVLSYLMEFACV